MRTHPVASATAALVLVAGLAAAAVHAQAIPPPGVEAARPPTERTLQPVDRAQTRERVRTSKDCRKVAEDMRNEYRIQADGVRAQYGSKIDKASEAARESLVKERDAKIAALRTKGEEVAKAFAEKCREDNRALLRSPVSPAEAR
jgi:hypothetical protein